MSEPFIAEIRIFAGNFAPRSWAFCDGQLLPISQNTALFSLIGTTYGGDGRSTTGLPNLQGRAPMHEGQGPGLTPRKLGEKTGVKDVTLTEAQMPNHKHNLMGGGGRGSAATLNAPSNQRIVTTAGSNAYAPFAAGTAANLAPQAIPSTGGSQSHTNQQPYLALNFIIALTGLYPSRS